MRIRTAANFLLSFVQYNWMHSGFYQHQSGLWTLIFGRNSINKIYSSMLLDDNLRFDSFQCRPSLWYKWRFSQSKAFCNKCLDRLFRNTTGQTEQPIVQQQHKQPKINHLKFRESIFFKIPLMRPRVLANSSGAIFPTKAGGNSLSKRLQSPNTVRWPEPRTKIGSGT